MGEQMESHERLSGRTYVMVWIGLLVLTGVSFGSSYVPLGQWETVVALAIATIKAVLVMLFFMHLLEAHFATQLVSIVTFAFIILLSLGIAADVALR